MTSNVSTIPGYHQWLTELKQKIRKSQVRAALKVNAELLALYWELGKAISDKQAESDWGDKVIGQLSKDLSSEFPEIKGFSRSNLFNIRKWYRFYSSSQIVQQPVGQIEQEVDQEPVGQIVQQAVGQPPTELHLIPWGHHIHIITKTSTLDEALFYVQQTAANSWSRAVLIHQIESDLYHRKGKALNNFELALPKPQSDLARELLKNPYNLDFLSLGPESNERDLENALIANIKKFLLELGTGFSYIGQQYHLKVGENDYYLDLLFYHTKLHCYVVVELKVTEFTPEFAGKLEFYLNAVDEQLKTQLDNPSIGLLLCKSFDKVVVEYSLRNKTKPMGVAEYKHALPKELEAQLPSIEELKEQLAVEVSIPTSPLQEKITRLKELIQKSGKEELQRERDKDDVRYLYNDVLPQIEEQIKKNLQLVIPEFTSTEISKRINHTSSPFYTSADLEKHLEKENVQQLGVTLRMEGFKRAGVNAFDIWKELHIDLQQFKYGIGKQQHKPWIEKLYHQKWTNEEIQELVDRWCEELIDEITERMENIL